MKTFFSIRTSRYAKRKDFKIFSLLQGNQKDFKVFCSLWASPTKNKKNLTKWATGLLLILLSSCYSEVTTPRDTAVNIDRRRGCAMIYEINWAGSMKNDGSYDADDDFIEIVNVDCNKPIDLTGWRIVMKGDVRYTFVIPPGPNNVLGVNQTVAIIAKADGAFGEQGSSDYKPIVLPGLFIPDRNWTIETFTAEEFLIENALNTLDGAPLSGAFDGVTTRSMERSEDRFEDESGSISNWFSPAPCNENSPSQQGNLLLGIACTNDFIGKTGKNVRADWALRTFATPGEQNTPDYK